MVNMILHTHKIGRQNRHQHEVTNGTLNTTQTTSHSHANHILSRYQIWFPPNMVPAKAALHVELHIVPRGTIQTKHGTREPHGPSVISGKTTVTRRS